MKNRFWMIALLLACAGAGVAQEGDTEEQLLDAEPAAESVTTQHSVRIDGIRVGLRCDRWISARLQR